MITAQLYRIALNVETRSAMHRADRLIGKRPRIDWVRVAVWTLGPLGCVAFWWWLGSEIARLGW
jgi:hypothetical protein